ncbi:hypothetical protein Q4575_04825 [Psychrosphaera sp. 1_MG-2023]|uniref:hypothetical protein n=1 Tax=Psychrosphaera sp. 1_MG-2023 TaxID=3062643 RepID=UPI0026E16961|nr:hypothetical protein [Psychrosphaera sp. 1_MG-2023]MDO6718711.1 hypothetical protein [Psychrosphaera sp. 1_MG-2023]
MVKVDSTMRQIVASNSYVNLSKYSQDFEFLESSVGDSSYINDVAHIQQNGEGLAKYSVMQLSKVISRLIQCQHLKNYLKMIMT